MAHTAPKHQATTNHARLQGWVDEVAALTQPDEIYWCDGSREEYDQLAQTLVAAGTFERLSDDKRPNSYLALSDPADVARVEDRTFICSEKRGGRRADQQLADPEEMRAGADRAVRGSMRGRTMYVVPFSMGPIGSPISYIGVQLTDSAYVAASMRDHDADGAGGARRSSATTATSCPACTPSGRRWPRASRTCRGRATPRTSTSSTSRRRGRSGRSAPATAATRCSARSASRCGSPRSWRATRAGWPSTC